ncbi:MAG: isochorismatase family protein [Desulfosoma sp.]|uniref:isochorismatase family protein n=1 Tax=Desulfosoma sp. TaxID=2603217 RepID=UPI004049F5C5
MSENVHAQFVRPENSLLFLVDVQKVMLDLCVRKDEVVRHVMALLDMAAVLHVPVLFSQHNAEKLGPFLPELTAKVVDPVILDKMEFSCFENDAMARAISASGRSTLILAGIETHVCIFHTGAHAVRLGYTVHVVSDAVTSRSEHNWSIGLQRLDRAGAVITSTEMVTFEWLNRAGTPQFRQALPILKKF